ALVANGTTMEGAASFTVNGSGWRAPLALAPTLEIGFLRAALARGQASPARAGLVILSEAGELVGLTPARSLAALDEASAYAAAAMLRLQAMRIGGWAQDADAARADEAAAFLRIMLGLLKDADAAYSNMTERKLPIGGLAHSLATLAVQGDTTQL